MQCNFLKIIFKATERPNNYLLCYKCYIIISSILNNPLLYFFRKIFITVTMTLISFFKKNFVIFFEHFFAFGFFLLQKDVRIFASFFRKSSFFLFLIFTCHFYTCKTFIRNILLLFFKTLKINFIVLVM